MQKSHKTIWEFANPKRFLTLADKLIPIITLFTILTLVIGLVWGVFFTPNDYSQQLGYMNRPKNYEIQPHLHNSISRNVYFTNEVLFIKSGKVKP